MMEVEVVRLNIGYMGSSTPGMVYSDEIVGDHMDEMVY